jgi:hypothetical protein
MKFAVRIIIIISLFLGCRGLQHENDKLEIITILKNERVAHFTKNAGLFLSEFSDSTYQIKDGIVKYVAKSISKNQITEYFNSSKIVRWDDLQSPVIQFSKDHTMAYTIVKKMVVTEPANVPGKKDTTIYAWVSILKKNDGLWKLVCNVSTEK